MMKPQIKYLLFDAANTLIYKPDLWSSILGVLRTYQYDVDLKMLKYNHKLLSELMVFPDKTSREFYSEFNRSLLLSLGIIPTKELIFELFSKCSYLPWHKFDDTLLLKDYNLPIGVLSNFNSTLISHLDKEFGQKFFSNIFVSEKEKIAKPSLDFFQRVIDCIPYQANEILYVGDSLKLDIEPGILIGFNVLLIDRENFFQSSPFQISDFSQIKNYL